MKYRLTNNFVNGLGGKFPKGHPKAGQPLIAGDRFTVMDDRVPGFGIRVTSSGQCTYILRYRIKGHPEAIRRAIGEVGAMTLADAGDQARDWLALLRKGVDPKMERERHAREAARRRANTFPAVAEDFVREKVLGPKCYDEWKANDWKGRPAIPPLERKGFEVARDIRNEFIPPWAKRPVVELTRQDIRTVIDTKKHTAPAQARNLLGTAKRMFSWAVDSERYGLESSPAETLKPSKVIGKKKSRSRILDDTELFALWRAAKRIPYPAGPVYQLLTLNALRLNEAADAVKSEFNFAKKLWTIPEDRMKGDDAEARAHVVPLTDDTIALLTALPNFKSGDFLFSTTFGKSPVWIGDKIKKRLDDRMLLTLRALARKRGDNPKKVKLPHWVNHDIRRTVRSNLSALRVAEEVREAVLAHVRPGIKGTYDLYDYLDEKREALELWAARLRSIVEPSNTANVVQFRASQV